MYTFNCKLSPSEVSLASPGIENIRHLPGNRAEVGRNYDARKAASANLSELGGYFDVAETVNYLLMRLG